jgi:hypothetical protein
VIKKLPNRRLELESVFRGILFSFICIFILPVIITAFILTAAILNLDQGFLASGLFRYILSFAFRISLIPGIVYLTYLGLSRLRDRSGEKRLALVLVSLILFTVFFAMPPRQQSRVAISVAESKPLREMIYRADSRQGEAVDNKPRLNSSQLQRTQL